VSSHIIRPKLGLWTLTALVAGNMIGSGIFTLPAALAAYGSISLIAWIFTAFGALLLALVFARLGSHMPGVGGPYVYCREGFGDFIGFQIAYNYWIALWVGNAAIATSLTGYLSFFYPILSQNSVLACCTSIGIVWLVTGINLIGLQWAGKIQVLTTGLKLLPLILLTAVGLPFIQIDYLREFNLSDQSHFAAFSGAATLTFWAFIGLESASVPADDIDDPKRNIPRATILGVSIASFIYILSNITIMGTVPMAQLAGSAAPYADAARMIFGPMGSVFIAMGAVIACFGALNGWVLLQGQIPFAAARDRMFPAIFLKQSSHGVPVVGLVFSSVLITLLLLLTLNQGLVKQFTFIVLLATLASLIPYFFTAMAELVLFAQNPKRKEHSKQLTQSVVLAILAGSYAYWAIIGSGQEIVFYGTLLLMSSLPLYVWMRWHYRV
jgi:APA family basic amino acid/polyamine antiporter